MDRYRWAAAVLGVLALLMAKSIVNVDSNFYRDELSRLAQTHPTLAGEIEQTLLDRTLTPYEVRELVYT